MKTITAILATVATFTAGQVLALTPQEVAADLQAQGYERIEIRTRAGTIKAEAIRGTEKLEVIYDADTGAVLKTEVETVRPGENTAPGLSIRQRRADQGGRAEAEDHGRGRGSDDNADHDSDDDDDDQGRGRGSDDGADHDRDDDHGRGRGGDDDDRRGQGGDD